MTSEFKVSKEMKERLVFGTPSLHISFGRDDEGKAIVIKGNRDAFLTLSNLMICFANSQDDQLVLTDLEFVDSEIRLSFMIDDNLDSNIGSIEFESEVSITWSVAEDSLAVVAKDIHALGLEPETLTYRMNTLDGKLTVIFSQNVGI